MNNQFEMQIIINDLDSMCLRIESVGAHPSLTDALNAVTKAKDDMTKARGEMHEADMRKRYDV